jgi:hypothetical protein
MSNSSSPTISATMSLNSSQQQLYMHAARLLWAINEGVDNTQQREWIHLLAEEVVSTYQICFHITDSSQHNGAKKCFMQHSSGNIRIPQIVMELAVKLLLKSKDEIPLDEVVGEDTIIDEFIAQSHWKDQINNNSNIPVDIGIGEPSTHWWTRFNSTAAPISSTTIITDIPPTTATAVPSNTVAEPITEEIQWKKLPTVVMPVRQKRQPIQRKRRSLHKLEEAEASIGATEQELVDPVQPKSKQRKVEGTKVPGTTVKLYFSPVSHFCTQTIVY